MSCDVAVAAFLMFAHAGPGAPARLIPAVAVAPPSVAGEPLFKDIVSRADLLRSQVEIFRKAIAGVDQPMPLPGFDGFSAKIGELAALDQKGH